MSTFDPYYKWLAIPPAEQPPHHYRLLGVAVFEADLDVIEAAADRQMTYLRQCATGEYVKESQQILNELSAARLCLLTPTKKQTYDTELKARLAAAAPAPALAAPAPSLPPTSPGSAPVAVKEGPGGSAPAPPSVPRKGDTASPADVAQQERRAHKLLDEQDFDAALPLLVKLAELPGTLYKTTADWARAELPKAKQKQEKLRERVQAACGKARELMKTYNYAEVTQVLEALPAAARSEEARKLLEQAGQNFEDCLGLQQEIDNAVKEKRYERLLPLVKRFLKLKPDSVRMQTLAKNLARNSPDRAVRNYKGRGKYFDVAGRLVEVKELAVGVFLIAGLVLGVTYGAKYLRQLPAAGELLSSKGPTGGSAPSESEAEKSSSKTSTAGASAGESAKANPSTAGIGPPPGVASTAAATSSGAKDDAVDESPQPIAEEWMQAGEWLVSPGNPTAVYPLPDHPPEEYTVSLRARRLTGKNTFAIGIPVGEKQVLVAMDAHQGTVSGLEFLDGKHVNNNEATRRGRLLLPDREVTIKCTVRKDGITCTCDGVTILDWKGDLKKLSLPPSFSVPDKKVLFLATLGSRVAVRNIAVGPPIARSAAPAGKPNQSVLVKGFGGNRLDAAWTITKAGTATAWKHTIKGDQINVETIRGNQGYAMMRVKRVVKIDGDFDCQLRISWKSQDGPAAANAAMQGLSLNLRDKDGNIIASCGYIDENLVDFASPISAISTPERGVGTDAIDFYIKQFNQAVPPTFRTHSLPPSGTALVRIERTEGLITTHFDGGKVEETNSGKNSATVAAVELEFRRYFLEPKATFNGLTAGEFRLSK